MKRKTSIIILTYNHLDYTKRCLESIHKYTEAGTYEIIIVDNASCDGTREWLKTQEDIKLILNEDNKGFPKGCNQGIQIAEKENDILLLNNDTIVTKNWLTNLRICLGSSPRIGAVGPVCNQQENRQGVSFSYQDFETMQLLASKNNLTDPSRWEEKAFLIGYCILIKREVMEQLGGLDEAYTPGYIEDNDLSLRILKLGYKLILCHDSFIHHYLGTSFRKELSKFYSILNKNRRYFYKKWKFDTFSFDAIKSASFTLIQSPTRVLELNCGIGVTLLSFQYHWKKSIIEGVEQQTEKRFFASQFTYIYKCLKEVPKNSYDLILIGDCLETVTNPEQFLKKLKTHLKKTGVIIGEIHNAASIRRINWLIKGMQYTICKQKKNFFTKQDIEILLNRAGYKESKFFSWYQELSKEEEILYRSIGKQNTEMRYTYYTFCACK